jgi:hypothetical protein
LSLYGDESRIIVNGTFQGEIRDIPLAEKEFVFSMTTMMRIAEGKVVEECRKTTHWAWCGNSAWNSGRRKRRSRLAWATR